VGFTIARMWFACALSPPHPVSCEAHSHRQAGWATAGAIQRADREAARVLVVFSHERRQLHRIALRRATRQRHRESLDHSRRPCRRAPRRRRLRWLRSIGTADTSVDDADWNQRGFDFSRLGMLCICLQCGLDMPCCLIPDKAPVQADSNTSAKAATNHQGHEGNKDTISAQRTRRRLQGKSGGVIRAQIPRYWSFFRRRWGGRHGCGSGYGS